MAGGPTGHDDAVSAAPSLFRVRHAVLNRSASTHHPIARKLGTGAVIVWAIVITAWGGYWMAGHGLPLRGPLHAAALDALPAAHGWRVYHILATDCACSLALAHHLSGRAVEEGFDERVLILGTDDGHLRRELATGRIPTVSSAVSHDILQRAGVAGAPWMVVLNPRGMVVYSGGYRSGPIEEHAAVMDVWILQQIRSGHPPPAFQAIGCAASGLQFQHPEPTSQ